MSRAAVESALQQFLNDNGAGEFSRKHLQPLTDKVMEAVAEEEKAPVDEASVNQGLKSFGAAPKADKQPEMKDGRIVYKGPPAAPVKATSGRIVNPRNPQHTIRKRPVK